ncbi:MAG: hypothetical protein K0S27_263 [Gammaproteobacteria bacterium]|jgi:hypothetical protein|nr:hypothetical protein [Gammaproteobacteria bacterium]
MAVSRDGMEKEITPTLESINEHIARSYLLRKLNRIASLPQPTLENNVKNALNIKNLICEVECRENDGKYEFYILFAKQGYLRSFGNSGIVPQEVDNIFCQALGIGALNYHCGWSPEKVFSHLMQVINVVRKYKHLAFIEMSTYIDDYETITFHANTLEELQWLVLTFIKEMNLKLMGMYGEELVTVELLPEEEVYRQEKEIEENREDSEEAQDLPKPHNQMPPRIVDKKAILRGFILFSSIIGGFAIVAHSIIMISIAASLISLLIFYICCISCVTTSRNTLFSPSNPTSSSTSDLEAPSTVQQYKLSR